MVVEGGVFVVLLWNRVAVGWLFLFVLFFFFFSFIFFFVLLLPPLVFLVMAARYMA